MSATQQQIQAAFRVIRQGIDETGYGGWVSNDKITPIAAAVANAVVAASPKPTPAPAPSPVPPPVPAPTKGEQK